MNNYCTLFDINYFTRGMALYESLMEHCPDFTLYVVAFDKICFDTLCSLNHSKLVAIRLSDLEKKDTELFEVKKKRTPREYCWTSTPAVIKYCMEKFGLDYCTYLDADIFFFNDPGILLKELEEQGGDVLLTEHRPARYYDQTQKFGVYCVQFMTFKDSSNARKILDWWRKACLDWCHEYCEDGKFGDQKYLDDWLARFENVVVLKNIGGGVAPWNVQRYGIFRKNGKVFVRYGSSLSPLIFYHFHQLKIYKNAAPFYGEYYLNNATKQYIYRPYLKLLADAVPESLKPYYTQNNFFWRECLIKTKVVIKYFIIRWLKWRG